MHSINTTYLKKPKIISSWIWKQIKNKNDDNNTKQIIRFFTSTSEIQNANKRYADIVKTIPSQLSSYIGGSSSETIQTSNESFDLEDAARGTKISTILEASSGDIQDAVNNAKEAQQEWASYTSLDRSRILMNAGQMLKEQTELFAELECLDTARPFNETLYGDIKSGYDCLEYMSGLAGTGLNGVSVPLESGNWGYTRREPIGVCVGIGAWNYPLQSAVWKSAPALAAGNSIILKPAPETPLTALELAKLYIDAGVPSGCVNVVLGRGEVGHQLATHNDVGKVSFTGSIETGRLVYQNAAKTMKQVTMELGGKSPLIIFGDSNLNDAVSAAMMANWYSNGEVCSNGTRVFVEENIKDEFLKLLIQRTKEMKIGDPMNIETEVGALISKQHFGKVSNYINIGVEEGADLAFGGVVDNSDLIDDEVLQNGYYIQPTIFNNCTDDMRIVKEEIFGPVMSLLTFKTEEEVVERANNSTYGLSAGVFTSDIQRGHRIAHKLQAGTMWINNYNLAPVELPWLGYKSSGLGRENGSTCLLQWTKEKSIYVEMNGIECSYK